MAVNKPVGDNARRGEKAQPGKDEIGRRQRLDQAQQIVGKIHGGQEAVEKKTSAKKFKGVRAEKRAATQ